MTTRLEKPLRREVRIDREPWVVTLTPAGIKLTRKGRRKGLELEWKALANGDAALAVALNASLRETSRPRLARREPVPPKRQKSRLGGGRSRRR
jgi:hypothetical protein